MVQNKKGRKRHDNENNESLIALGRLENIPIAINIPRFAEDEFYYLRKIIGIQLRSLKLEQTVNLCTKMQMLISKERCD